MRNEKKNIGQLIPYLETTSDIFNTTTECLIFRQ